MDKVKKDKLSNVIFLALPILILVSGVYFRVKTPLDFFPDIAIAGACFWLGYKTSDYVGD
jgi:hypothetical protein